MNASILSNPFVFSMQSKINAVRPLENIFFSHNICPLYKNQVKSPQSIKMCSVPFLSHQEEEDASAGAFLEKEGEATLLVSTTSDSTSSIMQHQKQQHQRQEEDEDPYDTMITFLTGRTKSERTSKERSIIFPVKVRCIAIVSATIFIIWILYTQWMDVLTLSLSSLF